MPHSGGDGYFMFIVHSRWIQVQRYSVCLVFLNGACVNFCKVMLCDSSGECPNSDISRLSLSRYDNSVVLYVRRLIHSTGKEC